MLTAEELEDIIRVHSPWVASNSTDHIGSGAPRHITQGLAERIAHSTSDTPHLVIIGSRRVGKTMLMHHIIRELHQSHGVPLRRMLYMTLDKPPLDGKSVVDIVDAFTEHSVTSSDNPLYLFLDEISSSKDWSKRLKNIYDARHHYHVRIVSSSSSALELSRADEIGRWDSVYVFPRMFHEYVSGRASAASIEPSISLFERIQRIPDGTASSSGDIELLDKYIVTGGLYWQVAQANDALDIDDPFAVANMHAQLGKMVARITKQDIAASAGVRDPIKLSDMVYRLAFKLCSLISYNNLSNDLSLARDTVRAYINHLNEALLTFTLRNSAVGGSREISKQPKIYFWDVAVPSAVRNRAPSVVLQPEHKSLALENIAAAALNRIALQAYAGVSVTHWRYDKDNEVDLIYKEGDHPALAFEIGLNPGHPLTGLETLIEKNPEFKGHAYLVTPNSTTAHRDHIGRLPLTEFLKVAGQHADFKTQLFEQSSIAGGRRE